MGESFNPSYIAIYARDEVHESWKYIHREYWAGNEVKNQIAFNNHNEFVEYRLIFFKQANTKKLEISDCNIINMITSSLAAITYYKITGTMLFSPSTLQPKRGFMIGMINYPSKNFIVTLNITPLGKISNGSSNIYLFRDDTTSFSPGLDFTPNTYQLYTFYQNGPMYASAPPYGLTENVEHTVATKVLGDVMTLYVDGQVEATTAVKYADRGDFTKLYAFVSYFAPANVVVKGLRFINLKND